MGIIKKIIHVLSWIAYILIFTYAIVCIPMIFKYTPVVVLSGSMEPTYKVGGVIYYKPTPLNELKAGDVITFEMKNHTLVSHRIVSIDGDLIETKGDANEVADVNKTKYESVKGRVSKTYLPYIGYYVKSVNDYLPIVVLITVIILILEFLLSNTGVPNINNEGKENNNGTKEQ